MFDFLSAVYPWTKSLHVISVISWMAGMLYLPRLFVYHRETDDGQTQSRETFATMERRLLRAIMNPAMATTWIFGLALAATPGVVDWSVGWPWIKAVMVICMTGIHHWLSRQRTALLDGTCTTSARTFRIMNEVPAVLMVVIVVMIIARPI